MTVSPGADGERRAGVLGSPIAHSLSPILHTAAYAALGLPWRYDAYDVDEDGLPNFLAGIDAGWTGLSLTMPLKRAVLPLLHRVSPLAEAVGAANTVLVRGHEGAISLEGDNTDVHGLADALREAGVEQTRAPAVLGAGATACSAIAALAEMGAHRVVVAVREPSRASVLQTVARRAGVEVDLAPWAIPDHADVVISTTPKGSTDALAGALPAAPGVLFDVLYDPWPTELAAAWTAAGGRALGGLELLLHQAAHQVTLMTGRPAPLEAMRAALAPPRRQAG